MIETKELNVKIKKLHDDAVIPQYARSMDAGFDLVAVEDVLILPGESKKVPIGLAFGLPEGYELQIRPRSGVSDKTKLRISNAPGTVDAGYRGEVKVLIDNISRLHPGEEPSVLHINGKTVFERMDLEPIIRDEGAYLILKGDRVAQGIIAVVPKVRFEDVDELDETDRGAGGFGSSGVRA